MQVYAIMWHSSYNYVCILCALNPYNVSDECFIREFLYICNSGQKMYAHIWVSLGKNQLT